MGSIPGSRICLEEGMATCSNILAWRIPWTEEPGWLLSIVSQRVGHKWSDWASTHIPTETYIASTRVITVIGIKWDDVFKALTLEAG